MRDRWFIGAILFEASLLGVAGVLSILLQRPLWAGLHWNFWHAFAGFLAGLPPFALFCLLLTTSWSWWNDIREFLQETVRPIFEKWSLGQLALLSIVAGVSEEALFRAVLQSFFTQHLGPIPALLLASLIFGLLHFITKSYFLYATLMGIYLGAIWMATENLLVPIIAHALYDFFALVWFLKGPGTKPMPSG